MKVSVISRYNDVWQGHQGVSVGSAVEKAGHLHCQAALVMPFVATGAIDFCTGVFYIRYTEFDT